MRALQQIAIVEIHRYNAFTILVSGPIPGGHYAEQLTDLCKIQMGDHNVIWALNGVHVYQVVQRTYVEAKGRTGARRLRIFQVNVVS